MNRYFINKSDIINNSNNSLWVYTGNMNDLIIPGEFVEVEVAVNLTVDGKDDGFVYVQKQYQWDIDEKLLTSENLWNETSDGGKWYLIEDYNILTPKVLPLEFLEDKFDTELKVTVNNGCTHTKKMDNDSVDKYGVVYDVVLVTKIEEPLNNELRVNEVVVTDEELFWSYAVAEADINKIVDVAKAIINKWQLGYEVQGR